MNFSAKVLLEHTERHKITHKFVDNDDEKGNSPLHLAATNGHDVIVRMLIEAGADIGDKNEDEETPLHVAAENGHSA